MQVESGGATGAAAEAAAEAGPSAVEKGKQLVGEPAVAASAPGTRAVSYQSRLLLKALLRAIAQGSYAPGTGMRPQVRGSPMDVASWPQVFLTMVLLTWLVAARTPFYPS